LREVLFLESRKTGKPVVFLVHPNECIEEDGTFRIFRRAGNFVSFVFADFLRGLLKQRNLGEKASRLLRREIVAARKAGFEFVTCSEYRDIYVSKSIATSSG
jgi:hypothetical protein